jgi:Effector protein
MTTTSINVSNLTFTFNLVDPSNGGAPSANDIQVLTQALAYLSQDSAGVNLLNKIAQTNNLTISFDGGGGIPSDNYRISGSGGTITWDPTAANEVEAEVNGVATTSAPSPGDESAAIVLAHEFAHATDPNFPADNAANSNTQYDTNAEAYTAGVEDAIGGPLGEPARYNHRTLGTFSTTSPDVDIVNVIDQSGSITGSLEESEAFGATTGQLTSDLFTVSGTGATLSKGGISQYFLSPSAIATTSGTESVTCDYESVVLTGSATVSSDAGGSSLSVTGNGLTATGVSGGQVTFSGSGNDIGLAAGGSVSVQSTDTNNYTLNSAGGSLGVFAINTDGSLTNLGTVGGLPAGLSLNGIAAN